MNLYNKTIIKKWEIVGIFWIIIIGSLLHFTYEWSNKSLVVALFSAVNESVWEHLKLGYWALVFFILIEYWFLREFTQGFFLAKTIGILVMEIFIVIFFYSYIAIFKKPILILDVSSFIVGAILCQITSLKIMERNISKTTNKIGFAIFILIGAILILFTFKTPHYDIFRDSNTGQYGIEEKQ
ncbi:MAG: hypothetical protein GX981_00360 [Tissierellia bacterium]|nr:hypothetical protein [Tissierellia bacterium]